MSSFWHGSICMDSMDGCTKCSLLLPWLMIHSKSSILVSSLCIAFSIDEPIPESSHAVLKHRCGGSCKIGTIILMGETTIRLWILDTITLETSQYRPQAHCCPSAFWDTVTTHIDLKQLIRHIQYPHQALLLRQLLPQDAPRRPLKKITSTTLIPWIFSRHPRRIFQDLRTFTTRTATSMRLYLHSTL